MIAKSSSFEQGLRVGKKIREYFDRVVVISLAHRVDRRKRICREMAKLGLYVGETPGVEFFDAIRPTEANGFPSAARRGSFLSHSSVARMALRDGLENILIIEDDAVFGPAMMQYGERLCGELESREWDIAFFGYLNVELPAGPVGWVPLQGERLGMHCYGLNGRRLKELTEYMTLVETREAGHPDGARFGADPTYVMFCARTPDCVTLMARPNLSLQGSIASDLSPRWFDKWPGLRQSAAVARRARFAVNQYWESRGKSGEYAGAGSSSALGLGQDRRS